MKFPFKKVGDTFSVDEYNALCYLLSKQEYSEDIVLELKAKHYKYGVYKLGDSTYSLLTKDGGYLIRKANNPITITFAHQNPTANFYIELKVAKQKEVTQNGITTTIYPYDLIDNLDDTIPDNNYEVSYETLKLKADNIDGVTSKVSFVPADYGLQSEDFISWNARMSMVYDEPEINYEDGREVDSEQIICETFNDMQRAIVSAPEGAVIYLRLRGATTYSFDNKLTINMKKKVYIEGGNIDSNSHSILDGRNDCKMFLVARDSTLSVKNCKFVNGNANVVHASSDSEKVGGAIHMNSGYENIGYANGLHVSYVILDDCIFENCVAERGGAIYNNQGKLDINNCDFVNCKATSSTNSAGAFGGAIMNTSVNFYNGATNQIAIDKSKYYYNNDTTSYISLTIRDTQNTNYFTNNDFTLNNLTLHYNNTSYNVTSVKDNNNQYKYTIQLPVQLPKNAKFYLTNPTTEIPSFCTRYLKVTGNPNTQLYVEMV